MIIVPVEKKVDWKRPPIALIIIVLINVLVFAFYQSDDQNVLSDAVNAYQQNELIDKEWSAYKAYARRNERPIELDKSNPDMPWYIVSDPGFDRFMRKNHRHYISQDEYASWREDRDRVESFSSKMSGTAYGFDSRDIQPLQLITYQFLHGGFMHILGNMVFLVLTGFAVEAALGSLRFLSFYLISGVASALLFALFESSGISLVGASGSISGVMAMYVAVFGMRKIQFFYWLFIFTGYVRAAAIIMLPFYVGFELYKYFNDDGSNVAYTAHIGGFLAGAVLVFLTQNLNKSGIDEEYIERDEKPVDPFAQSLNKLYTLIAQCEFKRAWEALKPLKKKYPNKPVLIEIEYNLVRAVHPKKLDDYLLHRLDKENNSKALVNAQMTAWQNYSTEQRQKVKFAKKSMLLQNALEFDSLSVAENIFKELRSDSTHDLDIAMLARRIAVHCQGGRLDDKTSKYNDLASKLASTQIGGMEST